jgi:hypothetical protein
MYTSVGGYWRWWMQVPELHQIKDLHVACLVLLFNVDDNFIFPGAANFELPGATVFMRFTMVVKVKPVGVITARIPDYIVLLPS